MAETRVDTNIEVYTNPEATKSVASFLKPSWLEVLVYALASFVGLCLINIHKIWQAWGDSSLVNPDTATNIGAKAVAAVQVILDSRLLGNIFVILFWAALGSIIYMFIWFTQNSLIQVRRQMVGGYISGDMKKRNYLHSALAHHLFFITLIIMTVTAFYTGLFVVLPLISEIFYGVFVNMRDATDIFWVSITVLVLAAVAYALKILLQIDSRFWRIYMRV